MAGVALDDIDCYFAWQAWHLWQWVGSGGALGQPWRRDAAAFCVASVALRDIYLRFMWQAWLFVTSTFDPPSLCVAGMALDDMDCYFAWQAWHLWHWAGSGGALGFRRGAGDAAAVGVAGMALGDIHFRFTWQAWYLVTSTSTLAWQAWHLWHWAGSGGALGFRRGAGDAAAVGVAGVALGDIHRFTWQAWYLVTSTSTLPWQAWHLWHWAGFGGALGF